MQEGLRMKILKTHWHNEPLTYTGTQLSSHFAYKNFGVLGDAIVAFTGPCDVKPDHMVDLEDSTRHLFIYSENMLHFIVEHFQFDLITTIALQRLLITNIIDALHACKPNLRLKRSGNDIYDNDFKLSVSIATASPVSTLIHTGVNIISKNTPVPARGLDDYDVPSAEFAHEVMQRYTDEVNGIHRARAKVRGVS